MVLEGQGRIRVIGHLMLCPRAIGLNRHNSTVACLVRVQPDVKENPQMVCVSALTRVLLPFLQGITGGVRAARGGHDVIMTPTSHCYFDYKQSLR